MAVKFTNNAKTTLASGINSSVTTATVTDGSVFPTLGSGEHFYCTFDDGTNNEIVKVTARSGNTLTIVRGVDNTTARSFSASDAAELRATSALLTDIQENIAAKSANQTVYNTTTASSATDYDIGIDPSVEANAMVFLNGVMQHHDTFSFSGSTLTFDTAPPDGMALEVIVDNLINLQSSNLTVDTFTAADVSGSPQTDFTLSDAPAAEDNLLVFIDGVFQDQDAYTISNQTLTITDGVTADFGVTVYVINPVNIGTPSDGTVTSSKLSGNITMPADLTVTGDVAFDSPTFVVDNANSRVGIGTASPSTLLDIVGDVKMSANLTVDTSTLHVDSTNNRVGIGTSSPAGSGLHIRKDTSATTNELLRLSNSAGSTTDGVKIVMEVANTSGNGGEIGVVRDGGSFNPYMFFSTSSGVGSSPTEAMRILSDGKVSVGGTSSNHLLNVTSATTPALEFTRGSGNATIGIDNGNSIAVGGTAGDLVLRASGTTGVTKITDSGGNITMTLTEANNVGIGTTSPDSMLHLSAGSTGVSGGGSAAITMTNKFDNPDNSWIIAPVRTGVSNTGLEIRDVTDSRTDMVFDGSGNVGIGTSSPAFENGNGLEIRNSSGNGSHLKLTDNASGTGATQGFDLYMFNSQAYIENYENAPTIFRNNGGERMRIDSSGNVGIGTDNPVTQLDVRGVFHVGASASTTPVISRSLAPAGSQGLFLTAGVVNGESTTTPTFADNSSSGASIFLAGNASDQYGGNVILKAYGAAGTATCNLITFENRSGTNTFTERMRIDGSGNLLVGTTSATGGRIITKGLANGSIYTIVSDQSPFGSSTIGHIQFKNSNGGVGSIQTSGSSTLYNTSSDYRLKENVDYNFNALERVAQLKPARFNFIADADTTVDGFLAHEVQDIVPEAITGEKDAVKEEEYEITPAILDDDGNVVTEAEMGTREVPDYQGIDQSKLVPLLTKAIQEQQEQIETLKQEIREIREGG